MKNVWSAPQLIALVRGTAEEVVLQLCKTDSASTYPNSNAIGCFLSANSVPCGPSRAGESLSPFSICLNCSALSSS
jgi:hypothetical protein